MTFFLKRSVVPLPLPKNLWEFIFHELSEKSYSADDTEVSGIAKQRFRDTLAEAQRFFSQRGRGQLAEDRKKILEVDTSIKPAHVKGNISKSALFDASTLAKELKKLGTQKWEVTSKVWVESLSYAASRSRGNGHVQQLSKGGELLTFVWLLMAHFGLRESWVETRFGTKIFFF